MDNPKTITHIGLCAGYGGIEIGLHRVIRNLRTVALCEIEAFACANLVAKMEAGLMDAAPIWTDLKSFPWAEFRDRVDILTGGYPCQPFSAAGKRLGTEDPRHLWPFIADGIRLLRPRLCFFENVEGHISLGLRDVIGELGAIGYTAAWGIFSASEVGAPHQRKRVFILAYDKSLGIQGCGAGWFQESRPHAGQGLSVRGGDAGGLADANHQHGHGEERGWNPEAQGIPSEHWQEEHSRREPWGTNAATSWPSRPGEPQHEWEPPRVVANNHRPHAGHGEQRPERTLRDLSGGCGEEWMADTQGAERWITSAADNSGWRTSQAGRSNREGDNRQTQPPLGRDPHGPAGGLGYAELQVSCDNRTDELRLLGNGVVPATAERAFLTLMQELLKGTN